MKTVVEILIDYSNSMGVCTNCDKSEVYLLPDGSTRMSLAKRILIDDVLPVIEDASKVFVRTFYSSNPLNTETVLELDTKYSTVFDRENLVELIDGIEDPDSTGGTPITSALSNSIEELRKYSDWDRKIILVTDGQETEKGNYKESALEAMNLHGIPCSIFVIGLLQNDEAAKMSQELAEDTNGGYVNLKSSKLDSTTVSSKLSKLKGKVLNNQVEKIINDTSYSKILPPTPISQDTVEVKPKVENIIEATVVSNENIQVDELIELKNSEIEENKDLLLVEVLKDEPKSNSNELLELIGSNRKILSSLNKQVEIIQREIINLTKKDEAIDDQQVIQIQTNEEEQRRIGRNAEEKLNEILKEKYGTRLVWENEESESRMPFDFRVVDGDEDELYIDCKATKFDNSNFYLTDNEWSFFLQNTKNYQIYFFQNIENSNSKIVKVDNLFDWILKEKAVPYSDQNRAIKAGRILFTLK